MQVIGQSRVVMSDPSDELPHAPQNHVDWQESVVIFVWDTEQQCYAYLRIGHEINQKTTGVVAVWCNLWIAGQYYKRYEDLALRPEDRLSDGFGGGSISSYRFDGKHRWTVTDRDLSAEFILEDVHPAFDFFPAVNNLGEIASSHIEATGRVSGRITLRGRVFEIKNALGYRDHSWGVRKWELMRSYRWLPAIFGNDFIAQAISMIGPDRTLRHLGYIVRDNTIIIPKQISIVTFMESDALTTRGGIAYYTLHSGEKLEVVYRNIVPGAMSLHRGLPCAETMSTVTCGDRSGVGAYTIAENTMGGTELPRQEILVGAYVENGLFPYKHGSSVIRREEH